MPKGVATKQIENRLTANMNMSKKDIMVGNFLGGLAWGLGTVIGASVVVGILVYSLKFIGVFEPLKPLFQNSPIVKEESTK